MDYALLFLLLFPACLFWICFNFHFLNLGSTDRKLRRPARLPPGPRRLPVIGNLLELGDKPHQSLAALSEKYGPVMSLKLGSTTAVVISSPAAAQEALNEKDQTFAGRTVLNAVKANDHHKFSVVFLPPSAQWRNLRKICSKQIFSSQCVHDGQALRRKIVRQLVHHVGESCSGGRAVDVGAAAFTTVLNLLSNTFFSVDLAHYDSGFSREFEELVWRIMVEAGKPNLADFFPSLRLFDPQRIQKKMTVYMNKLTDIFDGFINERLRLKASSSDDNDVLDGLLNLNKQHDHNLSSNDIRNLLVVSINIKFLSMLLHFSVSLYQ